MNDDGYAGRLYQKYRARRKKIVRAIIAALASFLLLLLLLEGALAAFDPYGMAYFNDLAQMKAAMRSDPRGYSLPPGTYTYSHWSATIKPDRTRYVPATNPAAVQVVFIGDSVTFGHGVNDDAAWVNLVAAALPDAQVINAGMTMFNSTNALRTLDLFPEADLFVFTVIHNDQLPEMYLANDAGLPPPIYSYLRLYAAYGPFRSSNIDDAEQDHFQRDRFDAELDAINASGRALMMSFEDEFGQSLAARHNAQLMPWYTSRISTVDRHADIKGNQEMAEYALPLVREALRARGLLP